MPNRVVIIGTGLAGYNLAREFRKLDPQASLTLITADDGAFYSKPMLSNAFAKQKTPDALIMQDSTRMASDLNATILTRRRVIALQPVHQTLQLDNGETLAYDQCVLAIGAHPIPVKLEGDAVNDILHINDLQDYARFRQQVSGKKHIAILGPGLIGCEFANDLVNAGFEVTVIGPSAHPLDRLVPDVIGNAVQTALTQLGVTWHLQCKAVAAERDGEQIRIALSDGETVQADVVLSAIGLQPNLDLAKQAAINTQRGIVVDHFLRTNMKNIYAVGDCAEVQGHVLPFVLPLMQGVRALAKTLSGTPTAVSYPPMPVQTKTPACLVVAIAPPANVTGEWQYDMTTDGIIAQFRNGATLLGFALTGKATEQKHIYTKQLPNLLN